MPTPHTPDSCWPRCAASAAIFRGSQVLMVERGKGALRGLWSLPGGHIEPGEAARGAALREVREETGVEAGLGGLLDIHEVLRHDAAGHLTAHYLIVVFFGLWVGGEPVPGGDAAAARFVPIEAVNRLQTTDGVLGFIQRAWERQKAAAQGL